MITPFECWNGGRVHWDGMSLPQFVFEFPPESLDMVTFLQLSGRICEVLTQSDWILNIGGQLFDIPDLPTEEINRLALAIGEGTGYMPVTVPYQLGNALTGYVTIPLALWTNLETGRADVYSPSTGLIQGHQLLDPQPQAGAGADTMHPSFQGGSARSLLQSVAAMAGDSSRIDEFLSSAGLGTGYDGSSTDYYEPDPYDAQTRFEEDSAGWPGGAYQNPDSNYYEPNNYDDYSASTSYDDY